MSSSTFAARFSDPAADPAEDRARLRFAVSMLGVGVMHFVAPGFFVKIVPRWFPWAKPAVFWSGVAEVGAGVLLAVPRTRRIGGWVAALTIVAVYPANIQMAVGRDPQGVEVGRRRGVAAAADAVPDARPGVALHPLIC